jgi:hypothetical protein
MDRNLLFFTLSLGCFYLILDEVMGKKRVSSILSTIGEGGGSEYAPAIPDDWDEMTPEQKKDIQEGRLTGNDNSYKEEQSDNMTIPWNGNGVYV